MEKKNVIGQIKLNVLEEGPVEVIITGHIRMGVITRAQYMIRKEWRKHVAMLNRERPKAIISPDKGVALKDVLGLEDIEPHPLPAEPIKLPSDLSAPPPVDQFIPDGSAEDSFNEIEEETEQANNPEESEEDNGTNEGTETVRRDDEEPGSEGSPSWQVG